MVDAQDRRPASERFHHGRQDGWIIVKNLVGFNAHNISVKLPTAPLMAQPRSR